MGKKNVTEESIRTEAREGYSLFERLAESNHRTKTVTVYTDNALGAELGYAFDEEDFGIKTGQRVRKGLIGELDELKERAALIAEHGTEEEAEAAILEIEAAKKSLVAKVKKIQKQMQASALVFTLQSVPELVIKDSKRKARKALGIKGKGIPEAQQEDYDSEYTCQLLAASVLSWEDKKVGKKFDSLSVEEAHGLQDLLPRGQFPLLDSAMVELSLEAAIANHAVDDVDF
jgi:hypothetical protein